MDPSMMADMGDMGGMDMSSDGLFYSTNTALARLYWYIILGVVGMCLLLRGVRAFVVFSRFVNFPRDGLTSKIAVNINI